MPIIAHATLDALAGTVLRTYIALKRTKNSATLHIATKNPISSAFFKCIVSLETLHCPSSTLHRRRLIVFS